MTAAASEQTLTVSAPSRLHFGMFSFGRDDGPQFGGVGMMIDAPRTRLEATACDRFEVEGPQADRVRNAVASMIESGIVGEPPKRRIRVLETPPAHVGLGSGTQLALATAALVERFLQIDRLAEEQRALAAGRGARSAIGTHGFSRGGFLIEEGKRDLASVSPLLTRIETPADWRIALIIPCDGAGLSGDAERQAFASLPPVPPEITNMLRREAIEIMAPAIRDGRFDEFSRSVYRFGRTAGSCFAAAQGGPYCSAAVAQRAERIRSFGVLGVGQSSWGPALFAFFADQASADTFVEQFRADAGRENLHIAIVRPDNLGARIST
jgi:beta-RFAP synthase